MNMKSIRVIDGRQVEFLARIRGDMKLIDVRVIGGGQGPASTWIEAIRMAREMVGYAIERDLREACAKTQREAARAARVAKHEAKQRRRAPMQSLRTLTERFGG